MSCSCLEKRITCTWLLVVAVSAFGGAIAKMWCERPSKASMVLLRVSKMTKYNWHLAPGTRQSAESAQ